MRLLRLLAILLLPLALAACGHNREPPPWSGDAEVAAARYEKGPPTSLTLITVVDNVGGRGDHAGLIINASERVIYDPAGSFRHPRLPHRNDVIFGFSDAAKEVYVNFHVRESHHMVIQRLIVPPEVAERALQAALAESKARPGQCAIKTAAILNAAGINAPRTWWPKSQMEAFAEIPGVEIEWRIDPGVVPNRLGLDRTRHIDRLNAQVAMN